MLIKILLLVAIAGVVLLLGRSTTNARHMAFRRLFLIAFAAAAAGAILFPPALTRLARLLGVGRGTDLLLYVLVVTFIGSLAMQSRRAFEMSRRITLTTRRLAILEAEIEFDRPQRPVGSDQPNDVT
ncbi:MAG: DUF2304 domain-containing protein [Micrococcales bacterium]|nr:DUF2304 domain-containing protein [Micrococcales bacterium]